MGNIRIFWTPIACIVTIYFTMQEKGCLVTEAGVIDEFGVCCNFFLNCFAKLHPTVKIILIQLVNLFDFVRVELIVLQGFVHRKS